MMRTWLTRLFVVAVLALPGTASADTFYIDARAGNDTNAGTAAESPWRSLEKVNATTFKPGDRLLFRAGGTWTGQLWPKGSGAENQPIVIDRYGEGAKPLIEGGGQLAAVYLQDQQYWELLNLQVTNDASDEGLRRGVLIRGDSGTVLRHIYLKHLDIHHVRGKLGAEMAEKATGGIGFEIRGAQSGGRFEDIAVEDCDIHQLDNVGLYLWSETMTHPRDPRWSVLSHSKVRISGNRFTDIGKNAIIIRATQAPVIERNVVTSAAARFHGNAIYVFGCKDAVMQFNEVSRTRFDGLEGAAFDSDYNSEGTTIQYNYSHDNGGGLVNLCANPASAPRGYNDGTIVRYNISVNETDRVIAFDGPATNTLIHNNTIYVGPGLSPRIVEFDIFGKTPGYASGARFLNNVVVNMGNGSYAWGESRDVSFDANCFGGNRPPNEPADARKVTADPMLVSPGSAPAGLGAVAGYQLKAGSPCANSGVPVTPNGGRDYWGNVLYDGAPDRGAHEAPKTGGTVAAQQPASRWVMPAPPAGVSMQKDVAYLEAGRTEKLDLYLPTDRPAGARSPAVLILHGGGWSGGDKGNAREFNVGTTLAKAGYVCASANYILEKGKRWPANLFDVKNAVRFLRANATTYGIDPQRIGVIGGSAGGHLALMLAYTTGMKELDPSSPYPGVSDSVGAVVDMYGPSSLLTRQATAPDGTPTGEIRLDSGLLTRTAAEDPALWKFASPVTHVRKDVPPTMILQGTADTTVDRDQSLALAAALKQAGATHELILLPGVGHTFTLETWENKPLPRDLRPVVVAFFDRYLKR